MDVEDDFYYEVVYGELCCWFYVGLGLIEDGVVIVSCGCFVDEKVQEVLMLEDVEYFLFVFGRLI